MLKLEIFLNTSCNYLLAFSEDVEARMLKNIGVLTLVLANDSIPLSCNFCGKFFFLLGFSRISTYVVGVIASSGTVLSAGYSIYLYNKFFLVCPLNFFVTLEI